MCSFFSFISNGCGDYRYFNSVYRKANMNKSEYHDSHSFIAKENGWDVDKVNKYEFNPLTKQFTVDQMNLDVDDRAQAEEWVNSLNFKFIVPELIIKPIINPLTDIKKKYKVTKKDIENLKKWASGRDSVGASVGASVRASVYGYMSSFFDIKYKEDYSCINDLWSRGFVSSFDGKTWRLHQGKNAKVVFEYIP